MNFNSFHEAVAKIVPASRAEVAVTATLMEFNGLIKITKDEDGRGMGFALPQQPLLKFSVSLLVRL